MFWERHGEKLTQYKEFEESLELNRQSRIIDKLTKKQAQVAKYEKTQKKEMYEKFASKNFEKSCMSAKIAEDHAQKIFSLQNHLLQKQTIIDKRL